jgi:hypothetical protein
MALIMPQFPLLAGNVDSIHCDRMTIDIDIFLVEPESRSTPHTANTGGSSFIMFQT